MTELGSVLLVVIATIIGAFGSLFFKLGSHRLEFSLTGLIFNFQLLLGFLLYGISSIFFVFALKGGELSVLYPIVALSYVWVSLISMKFLNEEMGLYKWLGVIFIILGVGLIGAGS